MLRHSSRLLGLVRHQPQLRTFFRGPPSRWDPWSDLSSFTRDMERSLDRFARLMPSASHILPINNAFDKGFVDSDNKVFRVHLDLRHFRPEDVKLNLKDRVLEIEAKMEQKDEKGNRVYQEVNKCMSVPENVDLDKLKSFLDEDGVLVVEAPVLAKESQGPKEIPVSRENSDKLGDK